MLRTPHTRPPEPTPAPISWRAFGHEWLPPGVRVLVFGGDGAAPAIYLSGLPDQVDAPVARALAAVLGAAATEAERAGAGFVAPADPSANGQQWVRIGQAARSDAIPAPVRPRNGASP